MSGSAIAIGLFCALFGLCIGIAIHKKWVHHGHVVMAALLISLTIAVIESYLKK